MIFLCHQLQAINVMFAYAINTFINKIQSLNLTIIFVKLLGLHVCVCMCVLCLILHLCNVSVFCVLLASMFY